MGGIVYCLLDGILLEIKDSSLAMLLNHMHHNLILKYITLPSGVQSSAVNVVLMSLH